MDIFLNYAHRFIAKIRHKAFLLTSCGTMLTIVIMVRNKIIKFCGVCGKWNFFLPNVIYF